ncbi:hypothetical protein A3D11_00330 [Candidatus Peribacteria bacterium RIFCSPHIGHO2_02_FULL_49_16]|nr:MAG: hypothetical protein A3D11_00330 [Candidatus Peribacteria bacterium RIFCSPHIGHO2_02_FULL_49_16]
MSTPTFTTRCLKNERVANNVYEMLFEKPQGFTFIPGQFVLFQVPLVDDRSDVQPRAYSLASTPDEEHLLFVMSLKPKGRSSRWIEEVLREGIEMQFQGPFGFFLLDQNTPKNYLFICTGAGISPFRSQIITALREGDTRRIDLIFGVRSEEDLFWQKELEEYTKNYNNFFLHLALSNPSENWKGHRGHVQTLIPQIVQDFSHKNVYICGNPDMTTELKKMCLEEWNVQKEDLHVEGYI